MAGRLKLPTPGAYRAPLYPHCTPGFLKGPLYPGHLRTRVMTKPTKDSRITVATVEAAFRDARLGGEWEHPDPECPGLTLRVRGSKVSWSFRGPRLGGKNPRWGLGDHLVAPKDARQRAWQVRTLIGQGLDPSTTITELVTGVARAEQLDLRVENKPSWEWTVAIKTYLEAIKTNVRATTVEDYRRTLENTPEFSKFKGRKVCDILCEEIEEAIEKVRLRGVKTHHKKVLVETRIFFKWLGEGARRRYTSVPKNFLLGATVGDAMRDVPGRRVVNKGIPAALVIGRALAIARSGVLGFLPSVGIMMVMGTVSRRRGVVEMNTTDWKPHSIDPKIYVWFQPPASRKTADNIQSSSPHQVPLVGWVTELVDSLERQRPPDDETGWLFPVARARRKGQQPKTPHMSEGTLNKNMDAMPGVYGYLSPHALRRAIASYGAEFGGFADGEVDMLLDHLEGKAGNVTRAHYDLDPRIRRKIEMMTWWTGWLDEQCAAAIAADPMLDMSNPETKEDNFDKLKQACYITRYKQAKWDAKVAKARKLGIPIWQQPGRAKVPVDVESFDEAAE